MKRWKKIFILLLTLSLLLAMNAMPVSAKEDNGYTYTITLYAGNKGAIAGVEGGKLEIQVKYDETVSFDLSTVTVTDEKYYVKGVRLSGRDNNDVAPAFTVTKDADYVVAYGMKGDMVGYTVKYQDEAGNELLADTVSYGNIGDKPVVAYRYIEGYVPQALALTKTLSANEAENVFVFTYTPVDPEYIDVQGEGNTIVVTNTVQGNAGNAGNANGAAGAGNANAQGDEANGGNRADGIQEPQDLIELDDNETPAADINLDDKDSKSGKNALPLVASALIGVGALAVLIALIIIVRKRLKSQK